jgi:hypothetical protein
MNNSHDLIAFPSREEEVHDATNAFPEVNYKVDHERRTWMEANCDNWPYFYDVASWPGALKDQPAWELSQTLENWLYRDMQFDCADHYGIVCFETKADALRFRNKFAPKGQQVILHWMEPWSLKLTPKAANI